MKKFLTLALCGLLLSTPALAAEDPVHLGDFGSWKAYYFIDADSGGKVCFMSAVPEKQTGLGKKKRGPVQFFVTHWAQDKSKNVVSVSAGYPYKNGSRATVTIDKKKFTLLTQDETAWTESPEDDNAIAAALRKGSKLSVTGTSKRGTETTDTYSLKGSGAAHDAISKECGF